MQSAEKLCDARRQTDGGVRVHSRCAQSVGYRHRPPDVAMMEVRIARTNKVSAKREQSAAKGWWCTQRCFNECKKSCNPAPFAGRVHAESIALHAPPSSCWEPQHEWKSSTATGQQKHNHYRRGERTWNTTDAWNSDANAVSDTASQRIWPARARKKHGHIRLNCGNAATTELI